MITSSRLLRLLRSFAFARDSTSVSASTVFVVAMVIAGTGCDSTTDTSVPEPELGEVTVLGTDCAGQPLFANTQCLQLEVNCPMSGPAKTASLWLTASPTQPSRGTVILGTGGGGLRFYEVGGAAVVEGVLDAGFDTVQRVWSGSRGWLEGTGGVKAAACHYATLATWLFENRHTKDTALCATGNSGGSSEVAYALSQYQRENIFDLAVLTGGPPMSRLDIGCITDPQDPTLQQCLTQDFQPGHNCPAFGCTAPPSVIDAVYSDTPCALNDQKRLLADSVLAADADVDFPNTAVRFVYGANDCGGGAGLGYYYYNALVANPANDVDIFIAPNTPHATFETPEGAAAIVGAIDSQCIFRH